MARSNNAITFGSAFNITAAAPIDSRMAVDTEEDLYLESTWPSDKAPIYKGMLVVIKDDGHLFILVDPDNYTDKDAWVRVGGDTSEITGDISELDTKLKDIEERLASLESRQDDDDVTHEVLGDDIAASLNDEIGGDDTN